MKTSQQPFDDQGSNNALLLERRMAALRLNIDEWRQSEPTMLDELQRLCLACESRHRCALDLATYSDDPTWRDWQDYCPNVAELNMLGALQTLRRASFKLEQTVEASAEHPQTALTDTD